MPVIWRFYHKEFIIVHSGLQLFVRYLEVSAIRAVRLLEVLLKFKSLCYVFFISLHASNVILFTI